MRVYNVFATVLLGLSVSLGACGTDNEEVTATASGDAAVEASATPSASTSAAAVPATGEVIEVRMITDENGNYFEPSEITASPGDVLRFTLVSGVHNVSFPAAENAGASNLPEASAYLQLPGQTYDLVVSMEPGTYAFQCDPHAALGMKGTLTVQ